MRVELTEVSTASVGYEDRTYRSSLITNRLIKIPPQTSPYPTRKAKKASVQNRTDALILY